MDAMTPTAPKRSFFSFLAWWRVDAAEVQRQVESYESLTITKSARGISLLLCLLSVALTVLLGRVLGLTAGTVLSEAAMWSVMGLLMYRGHRWAFMVAMLLWTFEKATAVFSGATAGRAPVGQLIFWAIYMQAFRLGYEVESQRKSARAAV